MTSAGYADLLAKIPAGADWIVADALEVEAIDPAVWALVQDPLRAATGRPADLHAGDPAAMEGLIEGLVMAGLGDAGRRVVAPRLGRRAPVQPPVGDGGPRPRRRPAALPRLQGRPRLDLDRPRSTSACSPGTCPRSTSTPPLPPGRRGRRRSAACAAPTRRRGSTRPRSRRRARRTSTADALRERLSLLRERWPALRERLAEQLLPAAALRDQLRAADSPTTPQEIGLGADALRATYRRAQMIRRRYTVLDLTNQAGILDECVEELFAPDGFWGRALAVTR